jgi:hypothetical protein
MSPIIKNFADSDGLAIKGVDLRPQACWERGFESPRGHGSVSPVIVVWSQVEVSATGRSLVKRSPTEYGAAECDSETSTMRKPRLTTAVEPCKKNIKFYDSLSSGGRTVVWKSIGTYTTLQSHLVKELGRFYPQSDLRIWHHSRTNRVYFAKCKEIFGLCNEKLVWFLWTWTTFLRIKCM